MNIKAYERLIERVLSKLGFSDARMSSENKETAQWMVCHGSILSSIRILQTEDNVFLCIYSPLVCLPNRNILPLYRKCLEINKGLENCSLALDDDRVILFYRRPLSGLDEEELEHILKYTLCVADELDNMLYDEFGAPIFTRELGARLSSA